MWNPLKNVIIVFVLVGLVDMKVTSRNNENSMKLHQFFSHVKQEMKHGRIRKNQGNRKLVMPMPSNTSQLKAKTAIGGLMSVKLPDNPSPIFLNQSPFYVF